MLIQKLLRWIHVHAAMSYPMYHNWVHNAYDEQCMYMVWKVWRVLDSHNAQWTIVLAMKGINNILAFLHVVLPCGMICSPAVGPWLQGCWKCSCELPPWDIRGRWIALTIMHALVLMWENSTTSKEFQSKISLAAVGVEWESSPLLCI